MIVDSSVAMKWLLVEALSDRADDLLRRGDLRAPDIVDFEVCQTLTRRVRQRLLSNNQAESLRVAFEATPMARDPWRRWATAAFELSLALQATFADCLFLARAVDAGDRLVTADERFARVVRSSPMLRSRIVLLGET